jgi:hypothetical protein
VRRCPPSAAGPAAGSVQQVEGVGAVVDEVDAGRDGRVEQGAVAVRPGGAGLVSSIFTSTCWPRGVVSTRLPSPPLAVRMSPLGAMARPSGSLTAPPVVTVAPLVGVLRFSASLIAATRFEAVGDVERAAAQPEAGARRGPAAPGRTLPHGSRIPARAGSRVRRRFCACQTRFASPREPPVRSLRPPRPDRQPALAPPSCRSARHSTQPALGSLSLVLQARAG